LFEPILSSSAPPYFLPTLLPKAPPTNAPVNVPTTGIGIKTVPTCAPASAPPATPARLPAFSLFSFCFAASSLFRLPFLSPLT
jgi:hypothetical protein